MVRSIFRVVEERVRGFALLFQNVAQHFVVVVACPVAAVGQVLRLLLLV